MLTREQLLDVKSLLPFEKVDVPELNGVIGVQGMTAGDAVEFYKEVKDVKGAMDVESLCKLIVRCVVDENRQRIFTNGDWELIMKWPHSAVQKVAMVAMTLNGGGAKGN